MKTLHTTSTREQQAWSEVGRTEVRPRTAAVFACLFLASLVVVGTAQMLDPDTRRSFGALRPALRSADASPGIHASWARAVAANDRLLEALDETETALEDASPLRALVRPAIGRALVHWGGVGNRRVVLGTDGWLAYRPGALYVVGKPFLDPAVLARRRAATPSWRCASEPDPRPAMLQLKRQLAARGIRLVVMPVPTKPMLYPASVGAGHSREPVLPERLANPSFDQLRNELEAAGIEVFDPLPALAAARAVGEEVFLRTDSHWSPHGVRAVSRALAARLEARGQDLGPARRWRREAQMQSGPGDLARMLEPASTARETVSLERVVGPDGMPWQPDAQARVLLLGDSFTNVFSDPSLGWGSAGGLAAQLAAELGRGIDRIAVNAGGASGARHRLAAALGRGPRLAGKTVVVWQFAVRELSSGDWPRIALPAPVGP